MGGGTMFTRRWLLRAAALASCIPGYGKRDQTLGVQLYTVRDIVLHHPLEILRSIAEIGYREVEVLRSQITPLAGYLKALGLRPVSVHFETPLITGNWRAWKEDDMPAVSEGYTFDEAIAEAKQHGFEYMVVNYLPPKERRGLDFYRSLGANLTLREKSVGKRDCGSAITIMSLNLNRRREVGLSKRYCTGSINVWSALRWTRFG
jgi:hypothetical protein